MDPPSLEPYVTFMLTSLWPHVPLMLTGSEPCVIHGRQASSG